MNQQINFGLCILDANTHLEKTVLLLDIQLHAMLTYTLPNGQKIAWGFLTSENHKDNDLLSSTQLNPSILKEPEKSGESKDTSKISKPKDTLYA